MITSSQSSIFIFSSVLMCAGFHLKSHGRKELWGKLCSQRPRVASGVRTGRSLSLGHIARGSPAVLLPGIMGACFSVFWLPTACSSGQVWGARQSRCPWRRNSKARAGPSEWVGNSQVGARQARGLGAEPTTGPMTRRNPPEDEDVTINKTVRHHSEEHREGNRSDPPDRQHFKWPPAQCWGWCVDQGPPAPGLFQFPHLMFG